MNSEKSASQTNGRTNGQRWIHRTLRPKGGVQTLMSQFREKCVTDERTNERTDKGESIEPCAQRAGVQILMSQFREKCVTDEGTNGLINGLTDLNSLDPVGKHGGPTKEFWIYSEDAHGRQRGSHLPEKFSPLPYWHDEILSFYHFAQKPSPLSQKKREPAPPPPLSNI